jgi:hypothetical protein
MVQVNIPGERRFGGIISIRKRFPRNHRQRPTLLRVDRQQSSTDRHATTGSQDERVIRLFSDDDFGVH